MVRNYQRKTQRASQYTKEILNNAVEEIRRGALTIYRAHKLFNIPKTTLFYHLNGSRGNKSNTQGRSQAIPIEHETRLAAALKIMESWGFGISRQEVFQIVTEFIKINKIKTPFRDDCPGDDWFMNFKRRQNLSIKKPQSVEYSRKKMTDPFVINNYFDILKKALDDLNLNDSPELIWNLDESSFSHDPYKTKIVGARGKPSSRTTSGPGRENTTILSAVSASGLKAPPLIVFKGKNIWDSWITNEESGFAGTAYAASPKGWMDSDIFHNYFLKTLLPALGDVRPVLLIYDGHSTHVNVKLIELARENQITILKLPPHSSHLLQPLDLAVFKSLKNNWDKELVVWQRKNVGVKIPKKKFSELIGQTWRNLSPDIIKNGFRKSGIFPFNRNVIPEEKFHPDALARWKNSQAELEEPQSKVRESQAELEEPHANLGEPQASTSNGYTPHVSKSNLLDHIGQTSRSDVSFEQLLLNTVKQTDRSETKVKRRKVAKGAEVITADEVLERLNGEQLEKQTSPLKKKKKPSKKQKRRKRQRKNSSSSESSNSEEELVYINSEDDLDPEVFEDDDIDCEMFEESNEQIGVGQWALVQYCTKKSVKHFVGQIIENTNEGWLLKFTKYRDKYFFWPEKEDTDLVDSENILKILPEPLKSRRGDNLIIKIDFTKYHF